MRALPLLASRSDATRYGLIRLQLAAEPCAGGPANAYLQHMRIMTTFRLQRKAPQPRQERTIRPWTMGM